MKLNLRLAKQITTRARAILDRQVFLADTTGYILAGNGMESKFSAEALSTAQTGRQIVTDFEGIEVKWTPFVYEDETLGVFGLSLESGPITPEAISLIQGLAEVITYQYFLIDRIQSLEVMRSEFIREALTTSNGNDDDLYRRADILQLNLRSPQAAILMRVEGFEHDTWTKFQNLSSEERRSEVMQEAERIINAVREGFQNHPDNLMTYMGHDTFLLVKGIGGEGLTTQNTIKFMTEKAKYALELMQNLQPKVVTVGVGQYYPDLGGLRKSYQDARLALEVGSRVWQPGQVYHVKQVGMYITLANASQERKAELAHQILAPLLRDDQLFKTVRIFLASGLNLTNAAEELHIHRNTLIYRLDKTKKLIGLDPRHFDDALQIKLGLMFYQPAAV